MKVAAFRGVWSAILKLLALLAEHFLVRRANIPTGHSPQLPGISRNLQVEGPAVMHLSCNFLCFQILNLLLDFSVILIKQKLLFLLCFDNMIALISSCVFAFASASAMQIGVYKDFSFLIELRKCKPS